VLRVGIVDCHLPNSGIAEVVELVVDLTAEIKVSLVATLGIEFS